MATTTENVVIKFTSDTSGLKDSVTELQKIGKLSEEDAKKFQMMEGFAEGVADALKEAGIDAKTLNKEVKSTVDSGKTLRTQFMEAKNEAVKLSREFGATSVQARNAAKSAAVLKDEIDDMNATLKALNPEAKLNAFVNLGQGVQGAFQAATGALQVFGVENERITKLAQQFQGVLNLTQGINSVLQLKDVYTQLRLVLGVTTTAQRGLNTAMLSNPAVIVIATIAALGAALYAFSGDTDDAADSQEELANKTKDANDELERQFNNIVALDNLNRRGSQSAESVVVRIKAGTDLLAFSTKELNNALSDLKEQYDNLTPENIVLFDPNGVKTQQDLTNEYNIQKKELESLIGTIEKYLEKKKLVKKVEDETIKLMKELTLEVIRNNKEVLNLSDEGFERLKDVFRITEANAYDVRDAIKGINKELGELGTVSTKVATTATELNQQLFDREDKLKDDRLNSLYEFYDTSKQIFEGVYGIQSALREREAQDLKEQKSKGLISEEQYQEGLKKIKQKAAEDDKKAALFSATLSAAAAIINALNTKPQTAIPAAVALASVLSALNIAKIAATPIPQFKLGTLNVGGGSLDSDGGMHAVVHRGEAIIPKDRNQAYHPTVRAIYNKQIKASDINAFVQNKLSGKMNHNVNAKINTKELARVFDRNKPVDIGNAKALGNIIADRLTSNLKRRQW